jgi:non-homologous end joining protein Ku
MLEHSRFIQQQKKIYREIECIVCPALNGEKVYFNNKGFNHLLRKNGLPRTVLEQRVRLRLLTFCKNILTDNTLVATHKTMRSSKGIAEFWGIEKKIDNMVIRVVIRKINKSRAHFFSIYSLKT